MEGALACAADYESALFELLQMVTPPEYQASVVGICADATALPLVPLSVNGRPLSELQGFADHPMPKSKLWKRHTAQPQADEATALAERFGEPFLRRTGGTISSEWMLPKLLELRDEAPELYSQVDMAMDLCEFLTYRLTGRLTRSVGSMSFKGLWSRDLGFPSQTYLDTLRPGFFRESCHFLRGPVLRAGQCAGTFSPELCQRFGLPETVCVTTGVLDGHTVLAALGALRAGDAALVIGTSPPIPCWNARFGPPGTVLLLPQIGGMGVATLLAT